jgi:uncharacterized protein (TIGR03083 family)
MQHTDACALLPSLVTAYADVIRGADNAAAVPTCPGWDLRKLTRHLGTTQRWAAEMVRTRATERLDPRTLELGLPDDPSGYPDWVLAGGDALIASLRDADPDDAMWAWGADEHVRFWSRRMVHEAVIHTADAQLALGAAPEIDAAVAVDAVDELLDNIPSAGYFAPNVAELRGDGASIHVHCTDIEGEWTITLTPTGYTWEHAHGKGTVAVRGAAADLELLLYGRLPADDERRFTRFGDVTLLDHWLANSAL